MPRGVKFPCEVCLEFFPTKLSLSTHLKMHQKPTCYICWMVFHGPEELERHQLQYHDEGPLVCPYNTPVKKEPDDVVPEDIQEQEIQSSPADPEFDPQMNPLLTTSPKFCVADGKRPNSRRTTEPSPKEGKGIITRSVRKIILKSRRDD